jgi:hypothetical protein
MLSHFISIQGLCCYPTNVQMTELRRPEFHQCRPSKFSKKSRVLRNKQCGPYRYPVHRRPSRADRSDGATGWKLSRYQRIVGLDQTRRSYRLHDSGRLNRYAKNSPQLFWLDETVARSIYAWNRFCGWDSFRTHGRLDCRAKNGLTYRDNARASLSRATGYGK